MADEQAGKRMNFQVWWLSSLLTWGWKTQQTQQTQQTWSTTQTGAVQQQKTTPFLPWISDNAELQAKNKIPATWYQGAVESWKIKTNIQLPWINTQKQTTTISAIDPVEAVEWMRRFQEQEEERVSKETGTLFEQWARRWWNNVKKFGSSLHADIVEYMADVGYAEWAFGAFGSEVAQNKRDQYINEAKESNLKYKKQVNDAFKEWQKKNVDQWLVKEYDGKTFSELLKYWDTAWLKYKTTKLFADNISLLPNIVVTAINTPTWVTLMASDVFIQESQEWFDEMVENGATYDEARNGAFWIWALNAWIEIWLEKTFWIVWPASRWIRNLFTKNATREVVKSVTKKTLPRILLNAWEAQVKSAFWEWSEEALQEIVKNIFVKSVNDDRWIFDNIRESFEAWWVMWFLIPWWALESVTKDVQNNREVEKNADIEALKYVAEWEQRKAQRIQAKERLKARFMQNEMNPTMDNGYTPSKEQAEQRAKEKKEDEQYEQELREEQNRENSKYQTQEWNNSWLSNSNNYDTNTNVGSNGEVNSPVTDSTFFNTDENWDYINYNGRKIYAGSKAWTKDQFTQLSDNTPYNPEYEEYFRNFQRLVEKLSDPKVSKRDTEIIWHTIKWKEVKMSKQALRHIFESHWKFNINTILEAINNPSWQKRETETTWNNKNKRPYMVLNLVDPSKKVIVAIKPNNWATNTEDADFYYVVSSRESNAPTTPSEDVKFQLKYEDKDYTPWVANKNEKDISWKEWLNLRNKLNKETVKQLAEKYWIKVEVIEWMIEILEKGIKKWYAYGKYVDDLLTLSEQIKESTAPHELLHAIFDMIDPETKTYLISQVMQSEWWTAEQSEEWLADSFSNFFRTGKIEWAPKSTRWKIKMFFKRVRSFVNWMNKWRDELEEIFTDIIDAKGIEDLQSRINQNEKITKAKEKMKKRFMEYEKNAEKIKSEKKNDEKYQTVYHGSPYEFEKFDSSYMWAWEWHQAHWWGHYVAVNEKTSRHYAERETREWIVNYKWLPWLALYNKDNYNEWLWELYRNLKYYNDRWEWVDFNKIKESTLAELERDRAFTERWIDELNEKEKARKQVKKYLTPSDREYRKRLIIQRDRHIEWINALKETTEKDWEIKPNSHNFYEVEIPDPVTKWTPTFSNYLEEDWLITRNTAKNFIKDMEWKTNKYLPDLEEVLTRYAYEWELTGRRLYSELTQFLWWAKEASKMLEAIWYDGIHYFWGADWEAYVIFNDDALEISNHEKYQKAWDINSEKFKKRFGDSKVVDENWNPLVVYHGTEMDFNIFWRGNWEHWKGFYFTEDMNYAEEFSGKDWNIMEVYLKMDKPLLESVDMSSTEMSKFIKWIKEKWGLSEKEIKDCFVNEDWSSELSSKIAKKMGYGKKDVEKTVWWEFEDIDEIWETDYNAYLWAYAWENWLNDLVRESWFDGIISRIYNSDAEWNEYIVFKPNQIKSATDNIWTYDINNPDIRYQRVYHWSPNAFDKFDSTHMWEWEGNQAHGRWHYVAVDPKTARTYAQEKFYKNEIEVKWRTMSRVDEVRDIPYALRSLYRDLFNTFAMWYYDVEEEAQNVIDRAKKEYEETVEYYEKQIRENVKPPVEWVDMEALQADRKKYLAEFREALEFIEELTPEDIEVREINDKRNFYEVEIPDPVKADTPTWSNYLEEQAKIKKSEINKFKKAYKEQKWEDLELFSSYRDWHIDWVDVYRSLDQALKSPKNASKFLQSLGYDGIHYDWQRDGECYVIFNDDDLEIKNHEKYQKAEYEYDENGNPKRLKFEEDNSEFDPSIFDWSREDQIESDKESEKNNAFYNAWIRYNNQNYKDDQLTFEEFIQWISKRAEKEQEIYDEKMKSLADSQNDPKLLELQLKAVKLMEKEWRVGKNPNGKNVSKEVRERQQKEVEAERENLAKEIFDYMYPWLKFEDQTYDDQKTAWDKEAEREMMGRQEIEEKLKLYKKDKNGNREAKDIKIDNPDIKLDKILSSWKFDEIFEPLDRVIEWKTPQGQKGRIDNQKDPKKYKSVMEKINSWKSKTKVTLKDVTQEARALEKYKAEQEAEKERKKKERQEAFAKKKQEEYKKNVRLKAFQKLVDMQRFEKYTFLTEDEIKKRRWFSDEEWKKITEQQDINFPPKKRWENAIRDFNKAVDSEVKFIIEWLDWQNKMKRKEAEKNLWEIWDIDIDVLLWKDEEKWQKEVEEFEKIAKEEKKKSKKEKNKRLEQAREDVTKVEIDTERENSKSEKKKIDKLIKSTKTDKTVRWSVKQFTSDIVTPVSTKIRNINKKIHMEVMRYFQEKDIKTNARLKEIDPFLKAMWKIRKDNPVRFMDIWVALANRNIWYANWLLDEYWVKVPTRLLDEIFDEAEDVGLNINYLWSYYPLSVKAPKSFLEELMKVDKWDIASEIEKRIMQESQKKWWPLEESEITAIINEVIAWEDKWPDVNTGNKHLKKRNTEIKWTPKMLEYCDDPISTLISYIEWMTQSIERAKFLGKSRSWNVHTLADYVYNAKNGLSPEQQDELMDLLKAVFNDANPNKFVQTWRDIATLTTLWSPSSTLTQLWDLSFSVYENGWKETLKAVRDIWCKNKAFNLQDMWVVNRWEEYTNINSQKNLLQKAIHNVFKLTFFSTFDTFWKSTFIQSTWKKRQKRAKMWEKWDKQLRKDIMKWTDDEYMTDKIINDLKKWVFSQDVALLMYMKLSNIQPLTKAQMPKAYLENPNWRLFYQFKTFGIKQLDYVLQETKEQTKDFKNLSTTDKMLKIAQIANMVFIMTLLWVWADELKDLTMRRKSNSLILRRLFGEEVWAEQIWEKMEDNVLKLFWLSRYTVMQMKSDPVDAITSLFTTLPATNIINYPFKDIYKAFKNDGSINWRNPSAYQLIPIVWKYRYWIYWGGQDKQQEALWKWKKKKKWWSGGWLRGKV